MESAKKGKVTYVLSCLCEFVALALAMSSAWRTHWSEATYLIMFAIYVNVSRKD